MSEFTAGEWVIISNPAPEHEKYRGREARILAGATDMQLYGCFIIMGSREATIDFFEADELTRQEDKADDS